MNSLNEHFLNMLIIGIFTFIPLWIGTIASEKSILTIEDFFLQNRSVGSIATFFTVSATWWSSFAFLGSSAYFYTKGPVYWTGLAWNIFFGIIYFVVGKRIWHYGNIKKYITPTDFIKDMYYSETLANLVTVIMIVFTLPYLQIQLSGGAYLIELASGGTIPWEVGGLIFYIVIIVYLWAGGLRAVAWADIFLGILIFLGMTIGGIVLLGEVGGIKEMFASLAIKHPEFLLLPGPDKDAGALLWVSMFIMTPIGAIMGPQMWLRMYAVKEEKTFNKMPFLLSITAIAYLGSMLIGTVGILIEPGLSKPDMIFPYMILKYTAMPMATFLLCCAAAAALSTSNSQIHAISAVYAIDIHRRYINPKVSERRLVFIGRWAILGFSLVAYLMLISLPGLLVPIGLIALSGTAQVIVPVIGALFWEKANAKGAIVGLISGMIVLFGAQFFGGNIISIHPGVMGLIVNAALFIVISIFSEKDEQVYTKIVELKNSYSETY